MRNLLCWIKDTYGNPKILITENGISDKGLNDDGDVFIKIRYHYVSLWTMHFLVIESIFFVHN